MHLIHHNYIRHDVQLRPCVVCVFSRYDACEIDFIQWYIEDGLVVVCLSKIYNQKYSLGSPKTTQHKLKVMDKQVNRICICCDLESGCIFIAIGRVFLTIVFTFALFVCYFNDDLKSQFLGPDVISEGVFHFYTIVSIPLCLVTMLCAFWFVRGAKSVRV